MRTLRVINEELIEICEFAKPNACFQTNEYPDNYDFCILREQINPFDLYYDNNKKDKQITQLTNNWNELEEYIEKESGKYIPTDPYMDGTNATYEEILDKMKEIKEGNKE